MKYFVNIREMRFKTAKLKNIVTHSDLVIVQVVVSFSYKSQYVCFTVSLLENMSLVRRGHGINNMTL